MREILFRAKRIYENEWVEGSLICFADGCCFICVQGENMDFLDKIGVIPKTVGQYTGRTDRNGKRIFEGDIVTGLFLFGLSVNAVVTFKDGAYGLEWYRGDIKTFDAFTSICNVEYEVIGKIHDNPELLKGE